MAKHRSTVFAVVRTQIEEADFGEEYYGLPTIIGVYLSLERAEEIKGTSEQTMKDSGQGDNFNFEVQTTTYYDE